MDDFGEFLSGLLTEGRVVFGRRPDPEPVVTTGAVSRLASAFAVYRLDVPGPEIAFDAAVAVESAKLVRQACWALVSRDDRVEDLAPRLAMSRTPAGPSCHVSADLLLRYLPRVHSRARAVNAADPLVGLLEAVFRAWPLSGVLAGLDDGPSSPPDLGGHPGLMMLYAERLATHGKPAWRPDAAATEVFELVREAGATGAASWRAGAGGFGRGGDD